MYVVYQNHLWGFKITATGPIAVKWFELLARGTSTLRKINHATPNTHTHTHTHTHTRKHICKHSSQDKYILKCIWMILIRPKFEKTELHLPDAEQAILYKMALYKEKEYFILKFTLMPSILNLLVLSSLAGCYWYIILQVFSQCPFLPK